MKRLSLFVSLRCDEASSSESSSIIEEAYAEFLNYHPQAGGDMDTMNAGSSVAPDPAVCTVSDDNAEDGDPENDDAFDEDGDFDNLDAIDNLDTIDDEFDGDEEDEDPSEDTDEEEDEDDRENRFTRDDDISAEEDYEVFLEARERAMDEEERLAEAAEYGFPE